MKTTVASLLFGVFLLGASLSFGQQQPRFPVDPQTNWAVGAKQKTADELKNQLAAGSDVLIIDVRNAEQFGKETLPGAINIPLAELEDHLKKIPKDKFLVFT